MSRQFPELPKVSSRFTRWIVLAGPLKQPNGQAKWLCRCDCGKEKEVYQSSLMNGDSTSCGCSLRGRVVSEETKELLRYRRSSLAPPRPKGSVTSEETKKKLSESAKAVWAARKAKQAASN